MKNLVVVILLVTGFYQLSAQTLIPYAGAVISTVNTREEVDGTTTKSRVGLTVGLGFNLPLSEVVSFQPELKYIQKGATSEFSYTEGFGDATLKADADLDVRIDYLEIPLMTKFSFGEKTKFFLTVGPSFGLGIGGKTKMKATVSITDQSGTERFSVTETGKVKYEDFPADGGTEEDNFNAYLDKRLDFGLQFGTGVLIIEKILIDLRYGLGLTELDSEGETKNRAFQITVGMPLNVF